MSLRHVIFHNFWLKVFSIASGTIIWMAIHHSINADRELTLNEADTPQYLIRDTLMLPISIVQKEGDTRVFTVSPSEVVLSVEGPASVLRGTGRKEIRAFVDLSDFHATNASPADLHTEVPHDVNVIDFNPHVVNVALKSP